jgi:hypothetical protein
MISAKTDANLNEIIGEIRACLEKTEATSLEANLEAKESAVMHEEVPKGEAPVDNFGARKKRPRYRHLAVRRRGQPTERTQGNGGSRKKLAAAHRGMTRREGVAGAMNRDVRDKARTRLYKEPRKDGRSVRNVGRDRNATTA